MQLGEKCSRGRAGNLTPRKSRPDRASLPHAVGSIDVTLGALLALAQLGPSPSRTSSGVGVLCGAVPLCVARRSRTKGPRRSTVPSLKRLDAVGDYACNCTTFFAAVPVPASRATLSTWSAQRCHASRSGPDMIEKL